MRTAIEVREDLVRNSHGDKEISDALEQLRRVTKEKGLPYHELMQSKFYGTLKYLLKELHDNQGTVLITDLDSNVTYRYVDPATEVGDTSTTREKIRRWINTAK